MLTTKIEEFCKKHTEFNFDSFLLDFEKGMSRDDLSLKYDLTEQVLRRFVYSLGLEFPKNKRIASVQDFKYKYGLEHGGKSEVIKEISDDLEQTLEKNRKLQRSINQTRDENNYLRRMIRREDRELGLSDNIVNAIQYWAYNAFPTTVDYNIRPNKALELHSWGDVFITSDQHANVMLFEEEVGNTYNIEEWIRRYDKVVDIYLDKPYHTKNLYFMDNGDNFDIGLFNEYVASELEKSIVDMLDIYVQQNIKTILRLLNRYHKIKYCVTPSNHLRFTEAKPNRQRFDTFDTVFATVLKYALKANDIEDRVEVIWNKKGYLMHDINGMKVAQLHGQEIRGINPNSISSLQAVLKSLYGCEADLIIRGHTHLESFEIVNRTMILTTGTLKGGDNYSVANAFGDVRTTQHQVEISADGKLRSIGRIEI